MKRIYARHTTAHQITDTLADEFISVNHKHGLVRFGKNRYNVGLYHNDILVGVASFSNPRTKAKIKEYQHELVRMAFKTDYRIVGGASKLISYYIKEFKPKNFFTYQTMSGEKTDVYLKSGMSLRSKGRPKTVLVKNGYTYDSAISATNKSTKYLYLNSQLMNLGPDHVLGTSIGEVYDTNGTRLTNKELFIRYCDYHQETIPGDNLYEYENPNYTHYIYRITSSDDTDPRYYIGRHSLWTGGEPTELVSDGYTGSGGPHFQNWKSAIQTKGFNVVKTIEKISDSFRANVADEKTIIGDLYKTDPDCLNYVPGGMTTSSVTHIPVMEKCCEIHGDTKFRGDYCMRCLSSKSIHKDVCGTHGMTTFNGKQCLTCQHDKVSNQQECQTHGVTEHRGDTCSKCTTAKGLTEQECEVHGITKHRNGKCLVCQVQSVDFETALCPVHGMTKHKNNTCIKCSVRNSIHIDHCPIHGDVKFRGGTCTSCSVQSSYTMSICDVHGETKFRGNKCYKCSRLKQHHLLDTRFCNTCHKDTLFVNDVCRECVSDTCEHLDVCVKHGITDFIGKSCCKCEITNKPSRKKEKVIEYRVCDTCNKEARHVDNECMSCKEQALYKTLECDVHGLTKHRGKTCCKCRSEEMKRRRQEKKNK